MVQITNNSKIVDVGSFEQMKFIDEKIHGLHDLPTLRAFDIKFLSFERGFRNIRMALSAYGFNPFSSLLCQWLSWLVFVFVYNLPP